MEKLVFVALQFFRSPWWLECSIVPLKVNLQSILLMEITILGFFFPLLFFSGVGHTQDNLCERKEKERSDGDGSVVKCVNSHLRISNVSHVCAHAICRATLRVRVAHWEGAFVTWQTLHSRGRHRGFISVPLKESIYWMLLLKS